MLNECKRYTVKALAITQDGSMYRIAQNENLGDGCTGEQGNCGCTHAEIMVLSSMPDVDIHTMVISHSPCLKCAEEIVKRGVKVVAYLKKYRLSEGLSYLFDNGVLVIDLGILEGEGEHEI